LPVPKLAHGGSGRLLHRLASSRSGAALTADHQKFRLTGGRQTRLKSVNHARNQHE
jgi:hypothetical protein